MTEEIESHAKSTAIAITSAMLIYFVIFFVELFTSLKKLNILVSGNQALALSALIFLIFFIIAESISRFIPWMKKVLSTTRRMGVIGLIFAILHILTVIFALNQVFPTPWLNQPSIKLAILGLITLVSLFFGFNKILTNRLGEKRFIYIQILGYLSLFFIFAHALLITKPSYSEIGKVVLGSFHQLELIFILVFFALILFLQTILYFLNKKFSLQLKILAYVFLFFGVSAIIMAAYIFTSNTQKQHDSTFQNNEHLASFLKNETNSDPDHDIPNIYQFADAYSRSSGGEISVYFLNENKIIVHAPSKSQEALTYQNFDKKVPSKDVSGWNIQYKNGNDLFLDTIVDLGYPNGYIVVSTDFTKSDIGFTRELIYSSFLIFLIIFLNGTMTILFTRINILNPIRKITNASKKMSEGELDMQIEIKSNDEFKTLANIFNNMAQRLKGQINDLMKMDKLKNEFIAIASHNLRTPLTTLRGYLDLLGTEKSGKLNTQQKNNLSKAQHSAMALASLIEELVNITSLETSKLKIERDAVDLKSLIENIIEETMPQANEKNIRFNNKLDKEEILTIGDKAKLKQAFLAVIENAIKFNKKGGAIDIEKIIDDTKQPIIGRREVIITIKDTGIGISKEERENVFQKFNRGTSTYTYEYEGVGLGLYLSRLIIQAHHGRIWFESEEGKGTTFYISLTEK